MSNLDSIFKAKSVAIIGASTKERSVGNEIVKNLVSSFAGKIYPINPKATELYNLPCYPSLSEVKEAIDLMIVVVPAAIVPQIMEEGGALGIKGAIIISAGFKETGNIELEEEVKRICEKYDISLIGPNCLGIINPAQKLNASFAPVMPPEGSVAFISQSGALCTAVLDSAKEMGIGFSKFMSVGNKAVINETAILEYLAEDEETKVIAMYVEQLSDHKALIEIARKITTGPNAKPIIILKSGRTSAGAGASASHTGALAGNDAAYEALFRQSGIIRAYSSQELFNYIEIFSTNAIKSAKRLAVITNAGGPGVLAIDAIADSSLVPAVLSEETKAKLALILPAASSLHNPIDILGDAGADRYQGALEAVLNDDNVDSVLLILTPQSMTEIKETAQAMIAAKHRYDKPVAASFMGEELVLPGMEDLKNDDVATYSYPEEAVKSLGVLNNFFIHSSRVLGEKIEISGTHPAVVKKIFDDSRAAGILAFPEARALAIMEAYGLPILKSRVATSREEAESIAQEFGIKMVMKIVSQDILHKSDAGGIMLNILPEEAGDKYDELMSKVKTNKPEAKLEGVLVQEMISNFGVELILGGLKDASFGNMVMIGLGGIFVEILKDASFGLSPLNREDVVLMIDNLKSKKILSGVRGAKPADMKAIIDAVLRLAKLLEDFPEIKELDINPLLAFEEGKGVIVLDARVIIE